MHDIEKFLSVRNMLEDSKKNSIQFTSALTLSIHVRTCDYFLIIISHVASAISFSLTRALYLSCVFFAFSTKVRQSKRHITMKRITLTVLHVEHENKNI